MLPISGYQAIRRGENGLLTYRIGTFLIRSRGMMLHVGGQLFGITMAPNGIFAFGIFNAGVGARTEMMDGIILTFRDDLGGTPAAWACVIERVADITDDPAADEASFEALLGGHPVVDAAQVPEAVRAHILRDIGPAAAAAGGDLILAMPHLRSLQPMNMPA